MEPDRICERSLSTFINGGLLACAALFAAGCTSDDGDDNEFTLTYEAPTGSGFGSGEAQVERFLPLLFFDFNLPTAVAVDGLVTDGVGAPLIGAEVSFVSMQSGRSLGSGTTDGTGNYIVDISPGAYDVVTDSGLAPLGSLTLGHVIVPSGAPFTQDVPFPVAVNVSGSVYEELGALIPSATLEFTGQQTGAVINVTADGFGDFTAALPPDVYDVLVTPAGPAAATQITEIFTNTFMVDGVQDFWLTEGVTITGVVQDDIGAALLEDSEIEVMLPNGSTFVAPTSVMVNPVDGTYTIGPVPAGNNTIRIKPPGDTGFPVQDFAVSVLGGAPQVEDFSLLAGFLLTGTIMQEGGITPEELVNILPIPIDGSLPPLNAITDAAGNYAVSLFPGQYDVSFLPELTNLQLGELQNLNITGDTIFDLDLTAGALLTGIVTDPSGLLPLEDVLVSIPGLVGAQGVTDAAGLYSLLAPFGTHNLVLQALDGSFEDFELADVTGVDILGATNLDFSIAFEVLGSTIIQGTVYQPDGTTPAVGVLITATGNDTGNVLGRMLTDSNGDYILVVP